MIERREREGEREKERQKERYREGEIDKREIEGEREIERERYVRDIYRESDRKSSGNLPNREIKRKERLIIKIMTRNFEEKLSAEIITGNYQQKS